MGQHETNISSACHADRETHPYKYILKKLESQWQLCQIIGVKLKICKRNNKSIFVTVTYLLNKHDKYVFIVT